MIKVSVIVPVYNSSETIKKCADSLINQSINDIEIIFVDDCSKDNSYDILQEIKEGQDNITLIRAEKNGGPGGARNIGIKYAQGEYIGFVDSDDYIDSTMYEKLYEKALATNATIVDCGFISQELNANIYSIPDECIGDIDCEKRNKLISNEGYIWNKLFKKEFLETNQIHFRENTVFEDTDFILHVYALAKKVEVVREPLYFHSYNPKSIMETESISRLYYQTVNTISAIDMRMRALVNYKEIRLGVESFIIKLYFTAIMYVIDSGIEIWGSKEKCLEELYFLSDLKRRTVLEEYQNLILPIEFDSMCINIMKINDKSPKDLLEVFE